LHRLFRHKFKKIYESIYLSCPLVKIWLAEAGLKHKPPRVEAIRGTDTEWAFTQENAFLSRSKNII
jgi:hypothetical protein